MAYRTAERVRMVSTTTGMGSIRTSRRVHGYRTLEAVGLVTGDTVDLVIEDVSATGIPTGDWEIGTYTVGTNGLLTRTLLRASSNDGHPVDWQNGTRWVSGVTAGAGGGAPITIAGTPIVGSTLTALIAAGYQNAGGTWTRNGTNIAGATGLSYALVQADDERDITYKSSNLTWFIPPAVRVGTAVVDPEPQPVTAPGAPTGVVATAGDGQVSVAFTAPASNGGAAIDSYRVTLSTGQTQSGASSPIVVTSPNDTAVAATVAARNSVGWGLESAASNSVTPQASGATISAVNVGTAAARSASVVPERQVFPVTALSALTALGGGGATADVPMEITYTGAPSSIQVRTVDFSTNAEVTPWATVATSPTGGSWTGTVTMRERHGWQKLEARVGSSGAALVQTTHRIAAGVLLGIEGQSQARGFVVNLGTGGQGTAGDLVSVYGRSGLLKAGSGSDTGDATVGALGWYNGAATATVDSRTLLSGGGSGGALCGNALVDALQVPVAYVLNAPSGATLSQINGYAGEAVSRYTEAGRPHYVVQLSHGTGDLGTVESTYLSQQQAWLAWHTGSAVPRNKYVMFPLIQQRSTGDAQNIRGPQMKLLGDNPSTMIYGGSGFDARLVADNVHLDPVGDAMIGRRLPVAILRDLGYSSVVGARGPAISTVTRTGATVKLGVTFSDGATALALSPALNSVDTTLTGDAFRVVGFAGGTVYPVSTASITGTAEITLNLATDPGERVRVIHGYARTPGLNVVTDNAPPPGMSRGAPLRYDLVGVVSQAESSSVPAASPVAAPAITGAPALLASWDFGDIGSQTLDEVSISQIAGVDGTSVALASTGAARPTIVARSGMAAGTFVAGTTQFLQAASTLGATSANGLTIVAVAEPTVISTAAALLDISNGASTGSLNRLMLMGVAGPWSARKAGAAASSDVQALATFTAQKRLVVTTYGIAGAGAEINVDGVGTAATGTAQAWPTGLSHTTLGARRASGAQDIPFIGYVWRVLVYGAVLSAAQREEIAAWAAANYGTANAA